MPCHQDRIRRHTTDEDFQEWIKIVEDARKVADKEAAMKNKREAAKEEGD